MELINPIYYDDSNKTTVKDEDIGLDFSLFTGDGVTLTTPSGVEVVDKPKKTRKRKVSNIITNVDDDDNKSSRELTELESNTPYSEKYEETTNVLKSVIMQVDIGVSELKEDLNEIRASKTYKRRFDYITMLQGAIGNFIGNKIAAAREINNTISKCNDLELKRMKELNLRAGDVDDDKAIMQAYQAFVNTPVGNPGYSSLGPNTIDMTLPSNNLIGHNIGGHIAEAGYSNYINNMTPQQNMMALESNPDIQEVVVFNQQNGAKYFEVMNIVTGEVIQNVDKKDPMFIEGLTVDVKNGVARHIDLGETYKLVIVGDPINEY